MGCQSSKEMDRLSHLHKQQKHQHDDDHAEAVSRCKQRKELVKHVNEARSAFSNAHTAYLRALTMVGNLLHALRLEQQRRTAMALQYTPADAQTVVVSPPAGFVLSSPPSEVCNGTIIRPPPPPPGLVTWDFGVFDVDPPDIFVPVESESKRQGGGGGEAAAKQPEAAAAEDDDEEMVLEIEGDEVKLKETVVLHHKYRVGGHDKDGGEIAETAAASASSGNEQQEQEAALAIVAAGPRSAAEVLRMVSDEFLKAAASGAAVTRMLEAGSGLENTTGLGLLGDPSRLKGLSWRRSEETDELVGEDIAWSHALTLERLCAWELKLYEEVKAVDAITVEFNKKRNLLAKLGTHSEVQDANIEYTRAEIKAVETQLSVAIQAMEATAAAVQKIVNEELHYQLVELLEGLTDMWKVMLGCHDYQRRLVADLQFTEDERGLEPVSTSQRDATQQLETALVAWQGSLKALISTEEDYIRSLTLWLAASIPKANNQKKQQITRRQARLIQLALPEIYFLCQEWEKSLADIPKDPACASIRKFAQTVSRIKVQQTEELKVQKKLQGLSRDLSKGERKLIEGGRKKDAVDMLKNQVKDEEARLKQLVRGSRRFASNTAPDGLRCLLEDVSRFCVTCVERHQELHSKAKQGIKLDVLNWREIIGSYC